MPRCLAQCVVVGGGYIGLETTAGMVMNGLKVTLLLVRLLSKRTKGSGPSLPCSLHAPSSSWQLLGCCQSAICR